MLCLIDRRRWHELRPGDRVELGVLSVVPSRALARSPEIAHCTLVVVDRPSLIGSNVKVEKLIITGVASSS